MARVLVQRRIAEGVISLLRSGSGVPAADNAVLSDTNIPPAQMFDACGYDSIFIGCDITGGTNPSLTIELLFRDSEAVDGSRWRRILAGARDGLTTFAAPAALETALVGTGTAPTTFVEMRTYGHRFLFPRITVVGGTTAGITAWSILGKAGRLRPQRASA